VLELGARASGAEFASAARLTADAGSAADSSRACQAFDLAAIAGPLRRNALSVPPRASFSTPRPHQRALRPQADRPTSSGPSSTLLCFAGCISSDGAGPRRAEQTCRRTGPAHARAASLGVGALTSHHVEEAGARWYREGGFGAALSRAAKKWAQADVHRGGEKARCERVPAHP
jgi:hypothetical protein